MRLKVIIFVLLLFSSALIVNAQKTKDGKFQPGPGMEVRKIGSAEMIVPKDARVYERGGALSVETAQEYTARKALELYERIEKIEARLKKAEDKQNKLEVKAGELEEVILSIQGEKIEVEETEDK